MLLIEYVCALQPFLQYNFLNNTTLYSMRFSMIAILIGVLIIFITDIWIYFKLRKNIKGKFIQFIYWSPSFLYILLFFGMIFFSANLPNPNLMYLLMWVLWAFLAIYIPKVIYVAIDFIGCVMRLFHNARAVYSRVGLLSALAVCAIFIYGAFWGRTDLHTKEVEIYSSKLPHEMDGFRIVQFSDAHIGNWGGHTATLQKAVQLINEATPDMVVFTGDFVNNFAAEITPQIRAVFQAIDTPKYGVYAVMGNHDYGDYYKWSTREEWQSNLSAMQAGIEECGFELLLNESRSVSVGDTSFLLIGVENTGRPPFRQYGNLSKSVAGADTTQFTILLSHDASHWRKEIIFHSYIDLTLSGHTHAAQSGIDFWGVHWSLSSRIYNEWDGLYIHATQNLYVNRGLGYVGVPMRVGMSPEITCITLRTK